ncbi:aldo/keto reductase [Streptomyces sp. NPDC054783]
MRWQIARNREQLGRDRLDLVLLHNPERAHPGDRPALHHAIRDAFAVLEEAVAAGNVAGYGVATWVRRPPECGHGGSCREGESMLCPMLLFELDG